MGRSKAIALIYMESKSRLPISHFSGFPLGTVVGDYMNTIKPNFYLSFDC